MTLIVFVITIVILLVNSDKIGKEVSMGDDHIRVTYIGK